MKKDYRSMLPSGKSQQQGGDSETGVRQGSPRKQEKPDVILPVNNNDSALMKRYIAELTKKDREQWQLSEVDKAMVNGADKACEVIRDKAEAHLIGLTSRMEWFPIVYHLIDKVALVIFAVLGYYTGKCHLNDEMLFLWLMAAMPIAMMSVIWAFNELPAWLGKKKSKSRW